MSRAITAVGLVSLALVAMAMLAVWIAPREQPGTPTAERYEDVRGADGAAPLSIAAPPSVLAAVLEPAPATPATAPVRITAPVERIVIARIEVDAQVVEMGITPDGALDAPHSPELVAWYGFTGKPGAGGNAVMSGHLDYHNYGPAVFWNLKRVLPGDRIEVVLQDASGVIYAVTATQVYPVNEVPMREVLATTDQESLTLITCSGSFVGGEYTHRLVVVAIRV